MKIKISLVIFCIFLINVQKNYGQYLTTSVIVPCHPKHAKYLYELLKSYEKQTILPDEVVISISEASQVDTTIIQLLNNTQWPFHVNIILSEKKLFAGQNRNIACNNAKSEIFICQDADDLPHPQRIEIIKYFFEKFDVDFLLHKFVYNNPEQLKQLVTVSDKSSIQYKYITSYGEAWHVGYMLFGQPAIHRNVFKKIQWPAIPIDEDNTFDNKVITTFKKCMMIHVPLYIYRFEFSATPYELYRKKFFNTLKLCCSKKKGDFCALY